MLYVVLVQVFVKKPRLYMLAFALMSYGESIMSPARVECVCVNLNCFYIL